MEEVKKMSMKFSGLMLIINGEPPTIDTLNKIFTDTDSYYYKETYYLFKKEILNDKYFWMEVEYGNPKPYSSTLIDTTSKAEDTNKRDRNQAEMNGQIFLLYDSTDPEVTLYLSDLNKKPIFQKYLNSKMNKDVVIKNVYIDFDNFVKNLKVIEKVKWVTRKNVLNLNREFNDLFVDTNDIFGHDVSKNLTCRIEISSHLDSNIDVLRKLKLANEHFDADTMVCVGRDDNNIEKALNHKDYVEKIKLNAIKNEDGLYDPIKIKKELIQKIEASK